MARVAVIAGDGIGPEVTKVALGVAEAAARAHGLRLDITHFDCSADRWLRDGTCLPPAELRALQQDFDAILLGALGDPRVPDMGHLHEVLLGLRTGLDLYVNLRPTRLLDARLCPLRDRGPEDVQFTIVRENTEGAYSRGGSTLHTGTDRELGIELDVNSFRGVDRILRFAFEHACERGAESLCMVDKSNILRHGHGLWLRRFEALAADYPGLQTRHLYVDAAAMQLIRDPSQFDVMVTCNLFGDILSDEAAQLEGGMGMAASANVNPETGAGLFEPVHGSAPDIAGQGIANPMAAIRSAAMMLEHLGCVPAALAVEDAVRLAVRENCVTPDLSGSCDTRVVGDRVAALAARQTANATG